MVDGHPAASGQASPTVPFDRVRLWRMVNEIRGYLAELRHIDAFMQWVEEHGSTPYPGWPTETFPHLEFPRATPGQYWYPRTGQVTLTFGRTFPLEANVTYMEPVTAEDIKALSAQLWEDAQRWADANMTWLSGQIGSITWPDETRYDQIRERLDAVADGLTVFLNEDFGELRNNLGFWRGDAAENFSDKFYNKFVDVVENQGWLIRKLVAAAAVFKGTIRYSQHALMNAVTYTRELLREQLRLRRDTRRGTELTRVFLTVAAGVTSVLSVYFSGGLSAAFTLAVIGQAFAGAAAMLPDNAPPREIKGATAEQLWTELFESVREIGQFVGKEYDYLFDDLREVEQREDRLQPGLTLVRPLLLDGPSGRTFHHITSPYFRGTDA